MDMAFETARTQSIVPRVLMCASLSNSSIEASAVGAFESVPIYTRPYVLVLRMVQPQFSTRRSYPSAMDAIIDPTKFLDSAIYHSLHTLRIRDINVHNEVAIFRVRRQTLTLLS